MKKIIVLSILVFAFSYGFSQNILYRYYNGKIKKHYYTINFNEYGNGVNGWVLEGPACVVYNYEDKQRGIVPFFRYFNAQTGDHYYTIHRRRLDQEMPGYVAEGPACFVTRVPNANLVPLWEYYNPYTRDHFYTVNQSELGRGFDGYALVGTAAYVSVR